MGGEQLSKSNCRVPIVIMLFVWSLFSYPSNVQSQEQPNTITFINQSGEHALVKLIGPSSQLIEVPNGTSQTVNVAAGEYYELVRYGNQPGHYRYSKGKAFSVEQTVTQYSVISITLHKVVGGNYPTHPISGKEFEDALIAQQTSASRIISKENLPGESNANITLFKPDTNVGSDIKEKWHAITYSDDGKELKKEPFELTLVVSDEVKKRWKGVWLSVRDKKTGITTKYRIEIGEEMKIPDSDLEIRVLAFIPNLLIQLENLTITAASNHPNNPAAKIFIRERGEDVFRSWLFRKIPSYSTFVHERFEIILVDEIEYPT